MLSRASEKPAGAFKYILDSKVPDVVEKLKIMGIIAYVALVCWMLEGEHLLIGKTVLGDYIIGFRP